MAQISVPFGAPQKLNAAALTTTADLVFVCQAKAAGGDFSAVFQAVGTLTTLVASLQVSLDGGTTWTDYIASANFIAAASPSKTITPLVAGALYRIHATTLTGSQDMWVCTN